MEDRHQDLPSRLSRPVLPAIAAGLLLCLACAASARPGPYDASANAKAEIAAALAESRQSGVPTLLLFGANWCPDCVALDKTLHRGDLATEIARRFRIVKVDIGDFDRNMDIAGAYGDPTKQGIPAAVALSADGATLYATRAGELSNARRMGDDAIRAFFDRLAERFAATPVTTP